MTVLIKDRVKQTGTAVTPTGNISFVGTPTGYVSFASVLNSGDQTYYCMENGSAFEIGIGTYGAGGANTFSRDTVLNSSTGSRLSVSGRATVFITVPAAKFPFTDPSGELNLALSTLNDVGLTAPASGQSLVYNGSSWANTAISGYTAEEAQDAVGSILTDTSSISFSYSDGTPSISASVKSSGVTNDMLATGIDVAKLGNGSVSSTELSYLDGVTSSVQTQLDTKYSNTNPSGYLTSAQVTGVYVPLSRTINLVDLSVDRTLSAGTNGTDVAWSGLTLNIPDAGETSRGVMTTGTQTIAGDKTFSGNISALNLFGTNTGDQDLTGYVTTIAAAATYLPLAGGTLTGNLLFTDATYDIGASGATRPRDGYFSRNLTVGGNIESSGYVKGSTGLKWSSWFGSEGWLRPYNDGLQLTTTSLWNGSNGDYLMLSPSGFIMNVSGALQWTSSNAYGTPDIYLYRDAAGILSQRNSTNAQTFRLAETYTSSTSFGAFQIKANAGAAYQIGSVVGSAGGNNRDLDFGHTNTAGSFTRLFGIYASGGTEAVGYFGVARTGGAGSGLVFNGSRGAFAGGGLSAYDPQAYTSDGIASTGRESANKFTIFTGRGASTGNGGDIVFDFGRGASTGVNGKLILRPDSGSSAGVLSTVLQAEGDVVIIPGVRTTGSPTAFTLTGAAHTTLTDSTEATDVNFNLARTVQFATGALTTQRAMRIQAPTYSFVGASTITTASTLSISGAPVAGTNATISFPYALSVESGNSYFGGDCSLFSFGGATGIRAMRANGTSTVPTQVLSGDTLSFYSVKGYHSSSAYHNGHAGFWGFYATENYTSSSQGSQFILMTTQNGSNTPTTRLTIGSTGTSTFAGSIIVTQPTSTSGSPTAFTLTDAAHTTMTASTEATSVNFNLSSTKQFATGAIGTQRAMRIQAPTYSFVGASTITTASTLSISGAPAAGTNATITNAYALNVESGAALFGGATYFNDHMTLAANKVVGKSDTGFGIGTAGAGLPSVRYFGGYNFEFGSGIFCATAALGIGPSLSGYSSTGADVLWYRDAAGVFAQRNGTNAQENRLYTTYTSTTSYERLNLKGKSAANFEIGPENGSAGGTLRGLTIGGYSAGTTTIAPWLTFTNTGAATFASTITASDSITTNGLFSSDRYAVSANYRFRRANGTSGSPSQVTSGQAVGALSSFGYHDSGAFHTSAGALIYFVAAENYTSGAHGTNIQFWTTPTTSTTSAKRVCIEASGEVTLEAGSHLQTSGAGFKIGTATSQKVGFWNATPVIQQILATGAGATVDDVISLLQTLGLCRQS